MSALTVVETDLAYDARARKDTVDTFVSHRALGVHPSIDRTRIAHDRRRHRARIQRDHDIHTHISHTAPRRTSRRAPRTAREEFARASQRYARPRCYPHRAHACDDDDARERDAHAHANATRIASRRTWIFVALKAATRETKEDARSADIVLSVRCVCENDARDRRRHQQPPCRS